ncbi:MAG: amidohydrolase family protein [Phycisphaerales bacterium]|nr:MAG: amidohydrolase family protein [Phycisphaerales bacterium]
MKAMSESLAMFVSCLFIFLLLTVPDLKAQTTVEPVEGLRENTPRVHALVNARIIQSPEKTIERGRIVVRDGLVESVGPKIAAPADARLWDMDGMTIYPGLLDVYCHLGLPAGSEGTNSAEATHGPKHWNSNVRPEDSALTQYNPDSKGLEKLRGLGFTAALIVPREGIFRGTSALVSLGDGKPSQELLRDRVAQHVGFGRARNSESSYPRSLMGAIALLRQTFLDAQWYEQAQEVFRSKPEGKAPPEANAALDALEDAIDRRQPVVFEVVDDLGFFRAAKLIDEFGLKGWIRGSGYEYRQLDRIKQSALPVILPLHFPEAPKVDTLEDALDVGMVELSHWESAPENPKRLCEAGVCFALTTAELKEPKEFYSKLREAVRRGLAPDKALAALTTVPAAWLGVDSMLGSIEAGKLADLVVTDGDLFADKTTIYETWVRGKRFEIKKKRELDIRGHWDIALDLPEQESWHAELALRGEPEKPSGSLAKDENEVKPEVTVFDEKKLSLIFDADVFGYEGMIRLSGVLNRETIRGVGVLPSGRRFGWTATRREKLAFETDASRDGADKDAEPAKAIFPRGAYIRASVPEQPAVVFVQGATLHTCGLSGTIEDCDMIVRKGEISKIGRNLRAPRNCVLVDARGKHVTPGIIDAHSHLATVGGVNEGAQACTAEVRIQDVIDSYDINIYRQLASGLTMTNILHGSANPIGGQNAVIKFRCGSPPAELIFEAAPPGLKFALGENVKRSNSSGSNTRYPNTRMGVEQILRDRFKAACDYRQAWHTYEASSRRSNLMPPRKDLELEALLEVIDGKRQVHCHAYRQDEILMFMRLAEEFGFKVNAFHHVLEGYKTADVMAEHNVGGSAASDWWAYKVEAYDGIPYAGALMHDAGVVVTFNSDNAELARRLNTQATKAVKYGGVDRAEALKFVTLNAAIQLGIEERVGSLEVGKDADFAVWNGPPLSTFSICEQTWVDGRKYFDRDQDRELRKQVSQERARLIQKILSAKKKDKDEDREDSKDKKENGN